MQEDGRVLLPAKPIYRVKNVSFSSATNPYAVSGRVNFPNRVNVEPAYTANPEDLQYQLVSGAPNESLSGWQTMKLDVGWASDKDYFNGEQLEVEYDTLTGYEAIWSFMLAGDRRIICGSVIPKGLNPVYLSMNVEYSLAKTAAGSLDHAEAAEALAEFINNFDANEDMDVSDISAYLRQEFSVVGYVAPLTIDYQLLAPDGRVIYYRTTDLVDLDSSKIIDPNTSVYPSAGKPELLLTDPLAIGVSDNTVRYLADSDLITFTQLS